MSSAMRRKFGFTLIELLIVIAIIAILAAILFPVFARARENARRASCMSNVKQIGLGVMQYIQDYDEKFPGYYTDPNGNGFQENTADRGWAENIQPYLRSTQIYQCPSEPTAPSPNNGMGYSDYFINALLASNETTPADLIIEQPTNGGRALAALAAPSLTVMNGDGGAFRSENQMANWPYNNLDPGQYRRHLSGNNFSFADGHCKWYRPESIKSAAPVSGGNPTFFVGETY
jgi:prepilin-type N-terminal cleavage/methylation domain-containing protein/prepilin-type processing-associated H-X9-DG protein